MSAAPTVAPSLGTLALLLIRLDARFNDPDQWVTVQALAAMYGMPHDKVRAGLQALREQGYVRLQLGPDGLINGAMSAVKA